MKPIDADEGWILPQRKPITREVLDRAIAADENAALHEHQAGEAWFDCKHGTVMARTNETAFLYA